MSGTSQKPECHLRFFTLLCSTHPDNSQVLSILLSQYPLGLSSSAYLLLIATSWSKMPSFFSWITLLPPAHRRVHFSCRWTHTQKSKRGCQSGQRGLQRAPCLACSLVQPSPLITFIECPLWEGAIRGYEESKKKLWSLPAGNLDNLVDFCGGCSGMGMQWKSLIMS